MREIAHRERRAGSLSHLPYVLGALSEARVPLGDLDGAFADAYEGAQLAHETRQESVLSFCLACCSRIEAIRGLEDDCLGHIAQSLKAAERAGAAATRLYAGAARGLLELGLGRAQDAVATLEIVARQAAAAGLDEPNVIPWQPDLVEAYVQAGRIADAKRELEVLSRRAESTGGKWSRSAVARCAGLFAQEADFDAHFDKASGLLDERPMPFEQARTDLCWGERQRRAGRRREARLRLQAAYETFSDLGAEPWALRAWRELQASGITARPRRDTAPVGTLTPQELRVALIIAGGATVREAAAQLFLSPKTIEAHLGRAYRKLGVRNRAQLATRLGRQQLDNPPM